MLTCDVSDIKGVLKKAKGKFKCKVTKSTPSSKMGNYLSVDMVDCCRTFAMPSHIV